MSISKETKEVLVKKKKGEEVVQKELKENHGAEPTNRAPPPLEELPSSLTRE